MPMEYNLLTQRLLAAGYTAEHYPDYVRIPSSRWGNDPLQNLSHGFEFTPDYLKSMVFKTGCGLYVKGSEFCHGDMSYMGVLWSPENDCPTICCPYRKDTCTLRSPILREAFGGGMVKIVHCDCHHTNERYDYEKSVDKAKDDETKMINDKYNAFVKSKNGHACHWHAHYNYWTGEWEQHYNPMTCAKMCMNVGRDCDLTHTPISRQKGNVFYDVKITMIRNDGSLFDGEQIVKVIKGVRLFETGKSITICEKAAKQRIVEERESHRQRHGKVEILNIRVEQRESRDLMQDLQDIRDGIEVIHESDLKKQAKQQKSERQQQRQEKKIKKLEKKIMEVGFSGLCENSLDRRHAMKWLGNDRIKELEAIRKERKNDPVQMSIFDFIGGDIS